MGRRYGLLVYGVVVPQESAEAMEAALEVYYGYLGWPATQTDMPTRGYETRPHYVGLVLESSRLQHGKVIPLRGYEVPPEVLPRWARFAAFMAGRGYVLPEPEVFYVTDYE